MLFLLFSSSSSSPFFLLLSLSLQPLPSQISRWLTCRRLISILSVSCQDSLSISKNSPWLFKTKATEQGNLKVNFNFYPASSPAIILPKLFITIIPGRCWSNIRNSLEFWIVLSTTHLFNYVLSPVEVRPVQSSSPVTAPTQLFLFAFLWNGFIPTACGFVFCFLVLFSQSWNYFPTPPLCFYSTVIIFLLLGNTNQPWQKSSSGLNMTEGVSQIGRENENKVSWRDTDLEESQQA